MVDIGCHFVVVICFSMKILCSGIFLLRSAVIELGMMKLSSIVCFHCLEVIARSI